MNTTFNILSQVSGTISVTNFPYNSGTISIMSPIGTIVHSASDSTNDFNSSSDIFAIPLPTLSSNGKIIYGEYEITVEEESTSNREKHNAELKQINPDLIITSSQDCEAGTATLSYTSTIPPASPYSVRWDITDPNGVVTQQATGVATISPIASSGTYQIKLTVEYTEVVNIGGNEVSVIRKVVNTYNYVITCNNARTILCEKMRCCLLAAFNEALSSRNPSMVLLTKLLLITAASVLIMMTIMCGKSVDAQGIFDKLNDKHNCDGCGDCGGCKDCKECKDH